MKKNILVAEDNDVNLELISLLIEQYAEEKEIDINLLTARNGQEAVDICSSQPIDIIFMDLMMPTMNGNEATQIIKTNHPKTMVIVISAFGDEGKQKEMLRNGAEDYMIKPVNASLFKSRFHNYLHLIQTRNHIGPIAKAKNLFTSKVYNYHMDFTIANENDLSEFWEAVLIRLDFQRQIDNMSDFVRFIYRLGTIQVQHNFLFHVIVEEDENHFFFTLDNIMLIGAEKTKELITIYYPQAIYFSKDNALSFKLKKSSAHEDILTTISVKQEKETPKEISVDVSSFQSKQEDELRTFNILDPDELDDFESYLLKLRSLILLMENGSIESADIDILCFTFKEMASILSISNDTYVISNALHQLSASITQNQDHFN